MTEPELQKILNQHISKLSLISLIGISGSAIAVLTAGALSWLCQGTPVLSYISVFLSLSLVILFVSTLVNGLAGDIKFYSPEKNNQLAALAKTVQNHNETRSICLVVSIVLFIVFSDYTYIEVFAWILFYLSALSFLLPWFIAYVEKYRSNENKIFNTYQKLHCLSLIDINQAQEIRKSKTYQKALASDHSSLNTVAMIELNKTASEIPEIILLLLLEDNNPEYDTPPVDKAKQFWQTKLGN